MLVTLAGDCSIELHGSVAEGEEIKSANSRQTVIAIDLALPLRGGKRHIVLGRRSRCCQSNAN